ncbi:hypothetical protein F8388_015172 [Cannabis sativa]|uniref:Uncharacterized protein n=1 Tax=Cannabis sativa TaxID=3483 RepID=A0A7J6ET44_CANSA|nr:hypothetical protein F8388_015172 [Cannabis sativa]KAF4395412.1 hypothetical protein G4B88_010876 [Cannabis sativa]
MPIHKPKNIKKEKLRLNSATNQKNSVDQIQNYKNLTEISTRKAERLHNFLNFLNLRILRRVFIITIHHWPTSELQQFSFAYPLNSSPVNGIRYRLRERNHWRKRRVYWDANRKKQQRVCSSSDALEQPSPSHGCCWRENMKRNKEEEEEGGSTSIYIVDLVNFDLFLGEELLPCHQHVEEWLKREKDRVYNYLHSNCELKLMESTTESRDSSSPKSLNLNALPELLIFVFFFASALVLLKSCLYCLCCSSRDTIVLHILRVTVFKGSHQKSQTKQFFSASFRNWLIILLLRFIDVDEMNHSTVLLLILQTWMLTLLSKQNLASRSIGKIKMGSRYQTSTLNNDSSLGQ